MQVMSLMEVTPLMQVMPLMVVTPLKKHKRNQKSNSLNLCGMVKCAWLRMVLHTLKTNAARSLTIMET